MIKPSRSVTRTRCQACGKRFAAARADARYCSGGCRQRAHRARSFVSSIDKEIEATRRRYWELVHQKALALGSSVSHVVTDEAQFVDINGTVLMHGEIVGRVEPDRAGWAAWGLEAAGPPFQPPPPRL